jgi:hypothetical protein
MSENLADLPEAKKIGTAFCNCGCGTMVVTLFDFDDQPMAVFSLPEDTAVKLAGQIIDKSARHEIERAGQLIGKCVGHA